MWIAISWSNQIEDIIECSTGQGDLICIWEAKFHPTWFALGPPTHNSMVARGKLITCCKSISLLMILRSEPCPALPHDPMTSKATETLLYPRDDLKALKF